VENERSIIKNLIQRATSINPQLAILCTDLEEKRVEVRIEVTNSNRHLFFLLLIKISNINHNFSDIIQRYIIQVNRFNTKYTDLTESLERKTGEEFQLNTDNDLKSLRESLDTIDLIIKEFEKLTNGENSNSPIRQINLYVSID
jgi:hypothetical protein